MTSSALTALMRKKVSIVSGEEKKSVSNAASDYSVFISQGFVSMPGSDEKVAVTIFERYWLFRMCVLLLGLSEL